MRQLYLSTVSILLLSILFFYGIEMYRPTTTIFTCTTFFDFEKQDKWAAFCKAMDSLQSKHDKQTLKRINKWLIVNEYSESPKEDWAKKIHEMYPFVVFLQKTKAEKGQAASMNIILKEIQGYKYWIHWEETWYCRAPCLDRMFDVMESSKVTQLQVTQHKDKPNWLDVNGCPKQEMKTRAGTSYIRIYPAPGIEEYLEKSPYDFNNTYVKQWPLYSLLPSINRTKQYRFGDFSTDPHLWPFKFEWDFARRWLKAGGIKAILPDGPVVRDNFLHTSTYS